MLKLCVAVRMSSAFAGFAVGLQAVTGLPQQTTHRHRAHRMLLPLQFFGQLPRALTGPTQSGLRIPRRASSIRPTPAGINSKPGLFFSSLLSPSAGSSHAPDFTRRRWLKQFSHAGPNGIGSDSCGCCHGADSPASQGRCLDRSPSPACALVKFPAKRLRACHESRQLRWHPACRHTSQNRLTA